MHIQKKNDSMQEDIYQEGKLIKRVFLADGDHVVKGEVEIFRVIDDSFNSFDVEGIIVYCQDARYPKGSQCKFMVPKEDSIWKDDVCSEEEAMLWMI